MATKLTAALLKEPIVGPDGVVTTPWARFFNSREPAASVQSGDAEVLQALQPEPGNSLAQQVDDLERLFAMSDGSSSSSSSGGGVIYGTRAARLGAGAYPDGTLYVITDEGELVYQSQASAWVFIEGSYKRTQAQIAAYIATLGATDAGVLIEVTDYRHVLRWTGSALEWGPNEDGRHDIVALPVDPSPTTGWQLCDGTTVSYLNSDGTTGSFATPDLTSAANKAAYLKLGDAVAGPTAAVAPTFTGNAIGFTTSTAAAAAGLAFLTSPTTQPITGSVSATGEPRSYKLRPWFRQ